MTGVEKHRVEGNNRLPTVTCATCRHYAENLLNPDAGLGHCRHERGDKYPHQTHYCRDHQGV